MSHKMFGKPPNNWRGAVWTHVNVLLLLALDHYAALPGPAKVQASQLADMCVLADVTLPAWRGMCYRAWLTQRAVCGVQPAGALCQCSGGGVQGNRVHL